MPVHQPYIARVLCEHLFNRRPEARAERAFEIAVLDKGYLSVFIPADMVGSAYSRYLSYIAFRACGRCRLVAGWLIVACHRTCSWTARALPKHIDAAKHNDNGNASDHTENERFF